MAANGQADMWILQWIADYPDGENFLSLFYNGKVKVKSNFVNPYKYNSAEFNSTFVQMNKELDPVKRMKLMWAADQMLVDDAVVMPILTDDVVTLINSRVRNFEANSLEIFDLSTIFIKELRAVH
jgi:peptide/nickel transport system substrate-binding protein